MGVQGPGRAFKSARSRVPLPASALLGCSQQWFPLGGAVLSSMMVLPRSVVGPALNLRSHLLLLVKGFILFIYFQFQLTYNIPVGSGVPDSG